MMRIGVAFIVLIIGVTVLGIFFFKNAKPSKDVFTPAPEVTITIPEGFTLKKIGERVRSSLPHITEEAWQTAVGVDSPFADDAFVVNARKPNDVDLEGYLFPDTYRFYTDATAEDVVEKLLRNMEIQITPLWSADVPLTLHELLTLASIIEREVRASEDMRLVADIFWRRLAIDMPLQADSTINYLTGNNTPAVSDEDREIDSPWNTYLYPGLPPGPIANPGLSAISAVFDPEKNNFWYFLTDDEGVVHYARTNDEHNANKTRYLR